MAESSSKCLTSLPLLLIPKIFQRPPSRWCPHHLKQCLRFSSLPKWPKIFRAWFEILSGKGRIAPSKLINKQLVSGRNDWNETLCCHCYVYAVRSKTSGIVLQGDMLYSNYGNKSNEELILGYGFSLPTNQADFFHVSLGYGAKQAQQGNSYNSSVSCFNLTSNTLVWLVIEEIFLSQQVTFFRPIPHAPSQILYSIFTTFISPDEPWIGNIQQLRKT